ncbi:hypothetical protein EDD16DRAFT_1526802 [Pisolithus croceorrhizus]|nr:hypothetical protein EV401DRAFT_1896414 [Pisolithus croceorrhizus]KAI6099404.1 hypothetical protein EDD16DRAFT_1526802 [Pisolithus croceorrhizus]KAI6168264.1 hypothetical protein EDD17DRAFT_1503849 [Pisolithus thermaeus]
MSQPSLLIPTPLATAVQDWLAVLDSAIQSDSDDNEADQKVAEEAVAWERVEAECWEREVAELCRQEEAEHWEREENEHQEKEENECQEREVEGRGSQSHDSVVCSSALAESNPALAEGSQSQGGPQVDHMTCAWCTRAKVDCTYKLAKATSTKKVWKCIVLAESMSLRASEKKKHAQAKSPEVEVVGGSLQAEKGKSVACDTSITSGLYAIAAAIDWHTEEMVQLWQMVKMLGSLHCHMIESMAELLQETMYPEPELPTESGSEESEEADALDKLGWK